MKFSIMLKVALTCRPEGQQITGLPLHHLTHSLLSPVSVPPMHFQLWCPFQCNLDFEAENSPRPAGHSLVMAELATIIIRVQLQHKIS